jgi:hypothetical protein
VIDQRQPVHVLQVVVALVRLQGLVRFREVAADEGHRHRVRAGLDRYLGLEAFVDLVRRLRHVRVGREIVFGAADLREEHALAVDRDLELVGEFEPGHVADDVAQQKDVELVGGVLREGVREPEPAARAQRQAFDLIFLRIVRRNAVRRRQHVAIGADGKGADLPRRRQILLEQ